MEAILAELVLILFLILANGFFAGAELAIISARRGTIAVLAAKGDGRAEVVARLQSDPHRFLATVQIGVTVVGSLASAVGGVTAVEHLKPMLLAVPIEAVRNAAEPLAIGVVVVLISYLSLVFGELAPKTIGLQYADRMALLVAKPINFLAIAGGVVVQLLTLSNRAVLALFGIRPQKGQSFITREEVLNAVAEGGDAGALSELEHKLIGNMLTFSQTLVSEVMVPRTRIVAVEISQSWEIILEVVQEHMYTRYPVYDGSLENVVGFIHSKDLLMGRTPPGESGFSQLLRPAFFVPESKKASDLLREMQRRRQHMALVVDEYGDLSGLVTTEDLLEELVGEIQDEHDIGELRPVVRLADGNLIVDGLISMKNLAEVLGEELEENVNYDRLAGLILDRLGRFPQVGETLPWKDYTLVCEEVTETAIVRVRIVKPAERRSS